MPAMTAALPGAGVSSGRPISLGLIPFGVGAHAGFAGPIVLAGFDGSEVAYVDNALRGDVIEKADDLAAIRRLWQLLSSNALRAVINRTHQGGGRLMEELTWRKSRRSSNTGGNCVEVAHTDREDKKNLGLDPRRSLCPSRAPLTRSAHARVRA